MRILLIVAFLVFPSVGFSGVGDVYFCESNKFIELQDGRLKTFKDDKFKFKRTSNGLIFGSEDGYFKNLKLEVKTFDMETELFSYKGHDEGITHEIFTHSSEGAFNYTFITFGAITSMTGKCSVF
jgi:hypothetical protein